MCIYNKALTTAHATLKIESMNIMFKEDAASCSSDVESSHREVQVPLTQKKVSFAPNSRVRRALRLEDYSEDEKSACWFSREDYVIFRCKGARIVRRMIKGSADGFCVRGLERIAEAAADPTRSRRERAYEVVLNEQEIQQVHRVFNPERVSALYREASIESTVMALRMAHNDAIVAHKINSV
jgi:hypothetical protein